MTRKFGGGRVLLHPYMCFNEAASVMTRKYDICALPIPFRSSFNEAASVMTRK